MKLCLWTPKKWAGDDQMVMWLKNSDNIFTAELIQKLDISDLEAVISSSRRHKMVWSHQARRYMDCQGVCPWHWWANSKRQAKKNLGGGHPKWPPRVRTHCLTCPWQDTVEGHCENYNYAASHSPWGRKHNVKADMMMMMMMMKRKEYGTCDLVPLLKGRVWTNFDIKC